MGDHHVGQPVGQISQLDHLDVHVLPGVLDRGARGLGDRLAQARGMRVVSFRHEQNAGYAASIAGFLTKKPGVCLTVSAPGFPAAALVCSFLDPQFLGVVRGWTGARAARRD